MGRSKKINGSRLGHSEKSKKVSGAKSPHKERQNENPGSTHNAFGNRVTSPTSPRRKNRNELDGSGVTRSRRPVSFEKLAHDFLNAQKDRLAPSSLIRLQSMLKRCNAFFRNTTNIALISEDHVRNFIRERRRETATGSLSLEVGALKQLFRMGVEKGLIRANPASKVIVRREQVETHYLTHDDFWRVLDFCPPWLKPVVALSVGTGMSRQELLRLRWVDVDQQNELICVHGSRRRSARQVPLNELSKHALEMAKSSGSRPTARIFNGRSANSTTVSMAFLRACRSAGAPHVSFKDLRHTSAKFMLQQGISLGGISAYLGHRNARTAVRYLDEEPVLSKAAKAIDFVVSRSKLLPTSSKTGKS